MSGTMDTAGALFNARFDNKQLRHDLLNKKEIRDTKSSGRVKRYRPGIVPESVNDESDDEVVQNEIVMMKMDSVQIIQKQDPRLERLKAAHATVRMPKYMEPEESKDSDESSENQTVYSIEKRQIQVSDTIRAPEDEEKQAIHRRQLLHRALIDEKEELEQGIEPTTSPLQDEDDYEYEEYDDSEDEGTLFALRHRPTFIAKANRRTIIDPEEEMHKKHELDELEEMRQEQRKQETQKLIEEVNVRELEDEENRLKKKDLFTMEEIPDDIDDLQDDEEKEAWRWREFNRILRDRQRKEELQREEAEKVRREHMTDEELLEENKRLEEEGVRRKKQEHSQGAFLQKYYHKGVFYLDEGSVTSPEDIRNRDFHEPTAKDKVNKMALPKAMQVRDFGKRSQSKWTYLRNEDTAKEKDWLNELQTKNAQSKFKQGGNS